MVTSPSSLVRFAVRTLLGCSLALVTASPAMAQALPPMAQTANLSGPRFGLTFLSPALVDKFAEHSIDVRPNITQFGWQWEKQFFTRDSGVTMVNEWVGLLGGLDQGIALPSLSWLVGIRGRDGAEFGIGPNVSPAGVSLVFAAGMTFRTRTFNVPVNIAYVPSKSGSRVSVMTGFSLRSR